MMKKTIYLFVFFLCAINISTMAQAELSTSSKIFLNTAKKLNSRSTNHRKVITEIKKTFPIKNVRHEKQNKYYIGGLMKINKEFDETEFRAIGGITNSKNNNIKTFRIPIEKLTLMSQLKGILYIGVDGKVNKKLDIATQETNVSKVHAGTNLPKGFSGKDVVVGIIDNGLQMSHPTFRDNEGNLRVKRIWAQGIDEGNTPTSFDYGTELTSQEEMLTIDNTSTDDSHGTHVASIAAGYGHQGTYRGVAYEADIVFVQPNQGESAIADAVSYIFDYAASVGKPAVINMSLGSHNGPHDGTSLLDQFFDSVTGSGRVLVGSAGNEGQAGVHIAKTLQPQDTLATFLTIPDGETVSLWGEPGTEFSVQVIFIDAITGKIILNTGFIPSTTDFEEEFVRNDSFRIAVAVDDKNMFNHKPTINITTNFVDPSLAETVLTVLKITGDNGFVDAWCEKGFTSFGIPQATDGDNNISVGEIGGTANSIITVGAYTTKEGYVGLNNMMNTAEGTVGNLAPFSSHGPTVDGRIKPDISGPGDVVIAAVNSKHEGLEVAYPPMAEIQEGEQTWYWGGASGTSMSSPMVAGIVALLLEANPELSAAEIKNILQSTARKDEATGAIPSGGNNLWGAGKVDAFAALSTIVPSSSCEAPSVFNVELLSPKRTKISWNRIPDAKQYYFQIRFKGMNKWLLTAKIRASAKHVHVYAPTDKTYEFRIATKCEDTLSDFSDIQEYTTSSSLAPTILTSRNSNEEVEETIFIGEEVMDIYPNPVSDLLTVQYKAERTGTLSIYHTSGVKVRELALIPNTNFYEVDMSQLENGYYFLEIAETGKSGIIQKIIKQGIE